MKNLINLLLIAMLSISAYAQKQPNIVFIMGDDIGWSNIGAYGGNIMGTPTPNIDRLANEGMKLTGFYAQPSCTAGRAAFITGQLPVRTGLTTVGVAGTDIGLQPEDATIAEVLKTKGYNTAQFGKNHLGDLEKHLPHRHGFDVFFGNLYHLNANEDPEDKDRPSNFPKPRGVIYGTANGKTIDCGQLTIERMKDYDREVLDSTKAYIKRVKNDSKPFFVYYNPSRLHVFQHYKDEMIGKSQASKNGNDTYGDGVIQHDKEVGELLDYLDQLGLKENTIVVYTTDNGPYQYMWPEGGTTPFAGDKGTTWEGGVRVPCLVRWPGHVPANTFSAEMMSMEDWFTTLASIAGEPNVAEKLKSGATYNGKKFKNLLEGMDQTAFITGKGPSVRHTYFYYDEFNLAALRMNQYKFVFAVKENGKWDDPLVYFGRALMVNLMMDPYERRLHDDLTRQLAEHKTWAYVPALGVIKDHFKSFEEFPQRQTPLSTDYGTMFERILKGMDVHLGQN